MCTSTDKNCFTFSASKGKYRIAQNSQNVYLFMHPSTMKTSEYIKGSLVVLYTEEGQLLFRCWPCASLDSQNLMLSSMYLFQDYLKGNMFCNHYNSVLGDADMVILSCDNSKSFMETESFKKVLKAQLDSIYIREGLKLNISYLNYLYHFTVKKIYSNAADKTEYEESLLDICTNISSLSITGNESVLENSYNEGPFCSTPISSKSSSSHTKIHKQRKKGVSNAQNSKPQQFYSTHIGTRVIIQKPKEVKLSNQIFFQHLGGLKKQINELKSIALSLLKEESVHRDLCRGIILVGASGTGKTAVVQAIKNEFCLSFFSLNDAISSGDETDCKYQLKKLYNDIIDNSPSIFFLDNIDSLSKNDSGDESMIVNLSTMIYDLLNSGCSVLVIGAARNITAVDASLRKPGTLEKEIYFEIPSADDRKEILIKILDRKQHSLTISQITEFSEMTHGFTGGDLKLLCDKADILSYGKKIEAEMRINFEDLKETLKDIKPSSMADFIFEIPKVKWDDIGGMDSVKTVITEMVDWPLKHAAHFKKLKITPSRGILLYGPPGCSKTMIAKALVSEGHLNFISIKGPQLFNKYVGESEKAVSELFRKARSAAPCVLFFDEIDSLASVRGSTSGNSNVAERILTQLLVEIDGIDVLQGVSIIAATNRPDMIDPSFLRPGRFDQMIYVPLPDYTTRKEIFEAKLKNMPLAADIDISYLVEATEGYTGAEITDICREAAMSVIPDYIHSPTSVVTMFHFLTALKSVMPRTAKEMIKFYENYNTRNLS